MADNNDTSATSGIVAPHDHDVLSGRGNFVNYHAGNEHFRALVRKHKVAYVACPKPQKGKFSRVIVDEIRARNPPGRFLKQDAETKLWYDIGDKKALDKTRQALREGAPELMKDLGDDEEEDEEEYTPRNHVVHQGYGASTGFGETTGFGIDPFCAHGVSMNVPSPSVVSSLGSTPGGLSGQMAALGRRIVPGMMNMPSGTTQLGQLSGSGMNMPRATSRDEQEKQQEQLFGGDHAFEPTPINPHARIRVADTQSPGRTSQAPPSRGLQRDNSLTFENLWAKDQKDSTTTTTTTIKSQHTPKKMGDSSQHLSAMSFSIGDMTDASNLSAVFQDSMRISDDGTHSSARHESKKPATVASSGRLSPHPHSGLGSLGLGSIGLASMSTQMTDMTDPRRKHTPNIDLSAASMGSMGLENSMMHMSFKSGAFDEDLTKDGQ